MSLFRRTTGEGEDISGDAVTDPPDSDGEQRDGEASEDRSLDSLQQPEATRGLVDGEVEDVMRLHAPDVASVRAAAELQRSAGNRLWEAVAGGVARAADDVPGVFEVCGSGCADA